jgi:hypothetical protein
MISPQRHKEHEGRKPNVSLKLRSPLVEVSCFDIDLRCFARGLADGENLLRSTEPQTLETLDSSLRVLCVFVVKFVFPLRLCVFA